ncbi:hypothetical protein [Streptomyces sp. CS62]|uniref:hypothetical protein n=1 Tax=Streptomyces sp. CS62 TaxID=3119268 RepID=UPI002F93AF8D
MQAHVHPRGGICLPLPQPPLWGFDPSAALRRLGRRITGTLRKYAAPVRLGLYSAAGTAAGTAGHLAGLAPDQSVGLGLNAAATAAAFWPPRPAPATDTSRTGTR